MRIVHVIARMDPGGAERVLLHLAEHGRDRHDITVLSGGGPWVGRLEALGVGHITIPGGRPDKAPGIVATARTVRRAVRRTEPDLVHTTNIRITIGAAIGVRTSGRRPALLTAAQGTSPEDMGRAATILRWTSPVVVGCAPSVTTDLIAGGVPEERIRTISNAAAFEPADDDRIDAARRRYDLTGDKATVVGLGRLVPQKNWPVLIDAVAGTNGLDVVIAGDGPLRSALQRQIDATGAPVRLLGHVDDVPALLASATCVVSTSDWEGLPLALLETMSLGVPVVATSVDGNPDHLGDGAVLVPRRDPASTRAAIEHMVGDKAHRSMIAAGARAVAEAWTPAAMVDAYHALYDELVPSAGALS